MQTLAIRVLLKCNLTSVLSCCFLATILGCGSKGPATTAVKGTVTFKGAPLNEGTVRFNPVDAKKKDARLAEGKIGSGGSFTLSTFTPGDGAMAGEYNVTVLAPLPDPNVPASQLKANPKPAFPEKYADPKTSDLKATVKAGEPISDLKLELKE